MSELRTAAALKSDADGCFASDRIERAIVLYGDAMRADAAAEWLEGGVHVRGLHFRCQCLANRAACHLKMRSFALCADDATAALTAVGAGSTAEGPVPQVVALELKLLARRGMARCQLQQYEGARADYARAVEIKPQNEQLNHDLEVISRACLGA